MNSLIVLMVLSLSLVGLIGDSYAEVGNFITSIDGTGVEGGGTAFLFPFGIAVDNENRIFVSDIEHGIIQIYDSTGNFIRSFDGSETGGIAFNFPGGIAVDNTDRIIVVDAALGIIQIYEGFTGNFITSFDGSETGGIAFVETYEVAVDSQNRIIVADTAFGGNVVQIFDRTGNFTTSFDGSETGGIEFDDPFGITVDNTDRIIVADATLSIVQVFDSDGIFIFSFNGTDGGTAFVEPFAVAVDSNDNIIVADNVLGTVQIFNSTGSFLTSFDGSETGGIAFDTPYGVTVDSNDRIIVADSTQGIVQIFEGFVDEADMPIEIDDPGEEVEATEPLKDDTNGGCADCTPPTLGLDSNFMRIVDYGFSYNGNSVQVDKWHTPFPLITAYVNQTNTVEVIVYENGGVYNMALVQFGLGATEIGESLNDLEVLIEVWLDPFGNNGDPDAIGDIAIEKIIIKDRNNLIETFTVFAVADIVKCMADSYDEKCLKVTLQYSYREATINNIMVVNVSDKPRNSQNFFFNDGVQVVGESLNEPPTYTLHNKKLKQQTENLYLTLTRTDKVNHIWTDESGVEYLQVSSDRFDRLTPHTPIECTDLPLDEVNVPTRQNCNFRELTQLWAVE